MQITQILAYKSRLKKVIKNHFMYIILIYRLFYISIKRVYSKFIIGYVKVRFTLKCVREIYLELRSISHQRRLCYFVQIVCTIYGMCCYAIENTWFSHRYAFESNMLLKEKVKNFWNRLLVIKYHSG